MPRFFRICLLLAVFPATTMLTNWRLPTAMCDELISRSAAEAHGLRRAWFTQVRLDPGRGRVAHVALVAKSKNHPDTLFVQTDRAGLHVIDAETGQTLWVKTVGRPSLPSLPLGVNEQMAAVVNGTQLYILSRSEGKTLWTGQISGVPTAGTAMSKRHVFVPTLSGRVVGYRLVRLAEEPVLSGMSEDTTGDEEAADRNKTRSLPAAGTDSLRLKQGPLPEVTCGSSGDVNSQPLIFRDDDLGLFIAWTTSRGLFAAHIGRQDEHHFSLLYELAGENEIAARPAYLPPKLDDSTREGTLFAASLGGSVFAHSERQGTELWRRATGQPIVEPVVAVAERLFVCSALGGMYCLDTADGGVKWTAPQIVQFVASSPTRVYAVDKSDRLLALDIKTGKRIDTLPLRTADTMLCNTQTDRIYMISKTGLVQCLHETGLKKPCRYNKPQASEPAAEEKDGVEKPKADEAQEAEVSDPFA